MAKRIVDWFCGRSLWDVTTAPATSGRPVRVVRYATTVAVLLAASGPALDSMAAPIGFTGEVSTSAGLQYGSGGGLVTVSGDLLAGSPLNAPAATPTVVGSFVLRSAGPGDLRSTPGTATLTTPSGNLVAVATHVNGPTLRDATTGAPLANPVGGPGPSTTAFASICSATRLPGQVPTGGPAICETNMFSTGTVVGEPLATFFGQLFAGDPGLNSVLSHAIGVPAPLPLVNLKSTGPAGTRATLGNSLTTQQQGLLGCGALFGTNCETNGISQLTLSAGTVIQSFPSLFSTHLTNDPTIAQPGTVGFAGTGCTATVGGRIVTLPGCRAPGLPGYNPGVDGNPAPIGFNPGVGAPGYQTPGQPFTGQAWQSVLAGFSWNLLMVLVAQSSNWDRQPFASASTAQCSYLAPQLCSSVQAYLRLIGNPLADDPHGTSPRWLWESGADYKITQASGAFAGLLGDDLHAFGPFEANGAAAGTGFLIDVVPEPGTIVLFGAGLTALAIGGAHRGRQETKDAPH